MAMPRVVLRVVLSRPRELASPAPPSACRRRRGHDGLALAGRLARAGCGVRAEKNAAPGGRLGVARATVAASASSAGDGPRCSCCPTCTAGPSARQRFDRRGRRRAAARRTSVRRLLRPRRARRRRGRWRRGRRRRARRRRARRGRLRRAARPPAPGAAARGRLRVDLPPPDAALPRARPGGADWRRASRRRARTSPRACPSSCASARRGASPALVALAALLPRRARRGRARRGGGGATAARPRAARDARAGRSRRTRSRSRSSRVAALRALATSRTCTLGSRPRGRRGLLAARRDRARPRGRGGGVFCPLGGRGFGEAVAAALAEGVVARWGEERVQVRYGAESRACSSTTATAAAAARAVAAAPPPPRRRAGARRARRAPRAAVASRLPIAPARVAARGRRLRDGAASRRTRSSSSLGLAAAEPALLGARGRLVRRGGTTRATTRGARSRSCGRSTGAARPAHNVFLSASGAASPTRGTTCSRPARPRARGGSRPPAGAPAAPPPRPAGAARRRRGVNFYLNAPAAHRRVVRAAGRARPTRSWCSCPCRRSTTARRPPTQPARRAVGPPARGRDRRVGAAGCAGGDRARDRIGPLAWRERTRGAARSSNAHGSASSATGRARARPRAPPHASSASTRPGAAAARAHLGRADGRRRPRGRRDPAWRAFVKVWRRGPSRPPYMARSARGLPRARTRTRPCGRGPPRRRGRPRLCSPDHLGDPRRAQHLRSGRRRRPRAPVAA